MSGGLRIGGKAQNRRMVEPWLDLNRQMVRKAAEAGTLDEKAQQMDQWLRRNHGHEKWLDRKRKLLTVASDARNLMRDAVDMAERMMVMLNQMDPFQRSEIDQMVGEEVTNQVVMRWCMTACREQISTREQIWSEPPF